jgi:hypothetical protein
MTGLAIMFCCGILLIGVALMSEAVDRMVNHDREEISPRPDHLLP